MVILRIEDNVIFVFECNANIIILLKVLIMNCSVINDIIIFKSYRPHLPSILPQIHWPKYAKITNIRRITNLFPRNQKVLNFKINIKMKRFWCIVIPDPKSKIGIFIRFRNFITWNWIFAMIQIKWTLNSWCITLYFGDCILI